MALDSEKQDRRFCTSIFPFRRPNHLYALGRPAFLRTSSVVFRTTDNPACSSNTHPELGPQLLSSWRSRSSFIEQTIIQSGQMPCILVNVESRSRLFRCFKAKSISQIAIGCQGFDRG